MKKIETLEEKIARVTAEEVKIAEYNHAWPDLYQKYKKEILLLLPNSLIVSIQHFGSTAVPNLADKPIIDILIEINDVEHGKLLIPEIFEPKGYDCFWRPSKGDDIPPWYTWCIARDQNGKRISHFHFVAVGERQQDLKFRDVYVII